MAAMPEVEFEKEIAIAKQESDMKTLTEVIEEMFIMYVRSEEYVSMNQGQRNEFIDQIEELKALVLQK